MSKNLETNLISSKVVNVVKKFMIFENIGADRIEKILNINHDVFTDGYHKRGVKLCQYEPGETVIKEGEFDSCAFWVVKGVYDVLQDEQVIASFIKSGEVFGEMSVFEGIPRTASVVSREKGICLCVDMSIVENLHDEETEKIIRRNFDTVTLERLSRAKEKLSKDKVYLEKKYQKILDLEEQIRNRVNI